MQRFTRLGISLLVIFVVASLLPTSATPQVKPAAAQSSNSVIIGYTEELDNLNPMYTTMYFAGITRDLYLLGAWNFDADSNPHPVLVTEIPSLENGGISADGLTITLNLRDDIVWSDGEPITAKDFVFTYEMIVSDSNTPLSRYPYDPYVAGVEAANDQTVVVTFTQPFAPWLATLFAYVLPEHELSAVFEDEFTLDFAEWNRAPRVANGPFVFDEWESGSFIRFNRNEKYFDEVAKLDVVAISFIPDDVSYVLALQDESIDIGTFIAYSDVPSLEETGKVTVEIIPSGYNEGWFFNVNEETGHSALQDVNVRRAVAMGFNREKFTQDLLLGLTFPAVSFWQNTPYANPDLSAIPFDPSGAEALLDEAGWVDSNDDGTRDKDGKELVLRYVTNTRDIRVDSQITAQDQLKDIGVGIELINHPSDLFFNGYAENGPVARGEYDIAQWSANTDFPDPDTSRFLCSEIPTDEAPDGNNWSGQCDEALDALFAQQAGTLDYDERVSLFHQIDQMLYDQVVWVGIWHDADIWVHNNSIANIALNGVTPFWNANLWEVE